MSLFEPTVVSLLVPGGTARSHAKRIRAAHEPRSRAGRRRSLRPALSLGVQTLKRFKVPAAKKTRLMELGGYYYAPEPGLFEMVTMLGDEIKDRQLCGAAHFIDNPERKGVSVYFKRDGVVVCKDHYGGFEPSDCVAHRATDI